MKRILINSSIIVSLLVAMTGCQKDIDVLATADSGVKPATGFGSSNIDDPINLTVEASAAEVDTNLMVFNNAKYSSDTKVTITVDTSLVNAYNNANGTTFDYLPADAFTFPSSITIPANSLQGAGKVALNIPKLLTYGSSFATGFTITAVSGGPGTLLTMHSHITMIVQVKNKYDGEYKVTGTLVDNAVSTITGAYPWDVYLITTGPNQVIVFDNTYSGDIYHVILSGGSDNVYGVFGLVFNFDNNDNVTSVTNYYGQPSSNGRSANLDPSGANKYDATSQSLDINYWMDQPSVITPHRTSFKEHYEYVGPRP